MGASSSQDCVSKTNVDIPKELKKFDLIEFDTPDIFDSAKNDFSLDVSYWSDTFVYLLHISKNAMSRNCMKYSPKVYTRDYDNLLFLNGYVSSLHVVFQKDYDKKGKLTMQDVVSLVADHMDVHTIVLHDMIAAATLEERREKAQNELAEYKRKFAEDRSNRFGPPSHDVGKANPIGFVREVRTPVQSPLSQEVRLARMEARMSKLRGIENGMVCGPNMPSLEEILKME